jgi:YesN/AraC family two-component response regulator
MDGQPDCVMDSHLFHPVFLSGHFKSIFETKYMNPVIQNRHLELVPFYMGTEEHRGLIGKLRQLGSLQKQLDNEFQTRNLLSEIWLLLLEALRSADDSMYSAGKNQDRILSMLSFIQENFSEKLTLEQIAASAAVSTRECLRCFRNSIRQSPMEYLMDYRIQSAKKLLETSDKSITDIALLCGFNSSSYFTKQFHKLCGKTPAAYRKEWKQIRNEAKIGSI